MVSRTFGYRRLFVRECVIWFRQFAAFLVCSMTYFVYVRCSNGLLLNERHARIATSTCSDRADSPGCCQQWEPLATCSLNVRAMNKVLQASALLFNFLGNMRFPPPLRCGGHTGGRSL